MEIIKNFGLNPILLAAQIVNFLIIFFILKKFLYKPVLNVLNKRQVTIKEGLKQAEEARVKLEKVVIEEKDILKQIAKLGWEKPQDTDSCSTNCLLNTLGNYSCIEQLGYHPYIGELSHLVRQNRISRKEAMESEKMDQDSFAMRHSLKMLGLNKADLEKK